jgi:hypothetical protein
MMTYQIADGYNAESLTDAVMQPRSPGLEAGRFSVGGDGMTVIDGYPSTSWLYSALTDAQFAALNTQFGVSRSAPSNQVTIQTNPHEDEDTWLIFNGIINYPRITREGNYRNGIWHDVEYRITRLTALAEESS